MPVKVIVDVPVVAVPPAVSVTVLTTPGVRVRVAGLATIPVGSPVMATVTVPLNPLMAVAVRSTVCPAPPAGIVKAAGAAAREKSEADVNGGNEVDGVGGGDPPPQASISKLTKKPQPAIMLFMSFAIRRMFSCSNQRLKKHQFFWHLRSTSTWIRSVFFWPLPFLRPVFKRNSSESAIIASPPPDKKMMRSLAYARDRADVRD